MARAKSENDILQGISNYANEVCAIIGRTQGDERDKALEVSRMRFNKCIPVSRKEFKTLLDSSREDIGRYSKILDIDIKNSDFVRSLTSEHNSDDKTPIVGNNAREVVPDIESTSGGKEISDDAPYQKELENILISGIQEITNTLVEDFKINDLILMIVETMFRGFCFNCIMFCMMEPKRKRVQARFGLGKDVDTLIGTFGFRLKKSSDLFNVAISEARDFFIDDANASAIKDKVPEWYQKTVNAPAFIIYPIFVDKVCLGLFYADKENKGPPVPENQLNYMKTLRNQLIIAVKQNRL